MDAVEIIEEHPMLGECSQYKDYGKICNQCLMVEAIRMEYERCKVEHKSLNASLNLRNIITDYLTWRHDYNEFHVFDFIQAHIIMGDVLGIIDKERIRSTGNN